VNSSLDRRIELLRVIAHPLRIKILEDLANGIKCVSDFQDFLGISQPNVSQHLSIMKRHGIIDYFVDGRLRCYFLKDPVIPDIIKVIKKDYAEELPAPACCPITGRRKYPGERRK
jgi:DNA-binding transcriptional ArsR family regulator